MVGVVQLVERQVVILNVAGSSPVTHPKGQGRLLVLPALSAAVQPNGKNHGDHQAGHPDADRGKAGSPEGRPDSSEEMPMSSPSSAKRRKYCHQRQGQHVPPLSSLQNVQVVILNVAGSSPVTHPKGQRVFSAL
jgi:hypothetical protein